MTLSRSLIKHLNRLHDCEVVITDQPNWRKNKPLTGRVIGWSYDTQNDDEPLVEVRFSSDLPEGWSDGIDNVSLSQIQLVRQPMAIPACQRKLVRHGA